MRAKEECTVDYLPIFLDIKERLCLVVGGGDIALRKIRLLLSAGAKVRVVAPVISDEIRCLINKSDEQLRYRMYMTTDLDGVCFVIAATDDEVLNRQVASDARACNLFVNVVDDAKAGSALMPSIVDRSPVMVAFSSGGQAPVLSRLLRERLEALLPHGYGRLAELSGKFRSKVKARFASINERRYFWEKIFFRTSS